MSRLRNSLTIGALISVVSGAAIGYEVETHRVISHKAVLASDLAAKLRALGLVSLDTTLPSNVNDYAIHASIVSSVYCLDAFGPGQRSILELVELGAFCEDATAGTQQLGRYVNHFYDPVHGGRGFRSGTFPSSLTWGIEASDIGTQDYSYKDAQNYLYTGLTHLDAEQRQRNLALAFRSLGHVVHLVQDLAQPQHTRDDSHGGGSLFEGFTEGIRERLPFDGYGAVAVTNPLHLWHTADGKGLGDYSNGGFVSAGTNFSGTAESIRPDPRFPRPDGIGAAVTSASVSALRTESGCRGADLPSWMTGSVQFIGTNVVDNYAGNSSWNPRTSTFSIFDDDLKRYADLDGVFTLNRFNFCEAHKLLIPRAVAYSAGLINYFFRGELEIRAPDEGVYAIVDHAVENQRNGGGFGALRLKLRNVTPGGTDAGGQSLVETIPDGAGALVAVVRFHRNLCYQSDLAGEYGSPGIDWQICRSPTEEIVVSQPASVPAGFNQQPQPVTFTFPTKVPIEATDLFLQIVYRGPLGEEGDAVVVATRDISEPTYVTQFVTADQFLYCANGVLSSTPPCNAIYTFRQSFCEQLHPELTYAQCAQRYGSALKFRGYPVGQPIAGYDPASPSFPPGEWVAIASEPPLAPVATLATEVGRFARVAMLIDAAPTDPVLVVTENGVGPMAHSFMWQTGTMAPTINQVDPASGEMTINRHYASARGVFVDTTPPPGSPTLSSYALLTSGTAPDVPPLQLVTSQPGY